MSAIYIVGLAGVMSGPVELPVVPGVGVQMPESAVELSGELPECAEGCVWVLVDSVPVQMIDHRGLVYRTDTGRQLEWSSLGELPEEVTALPFPGPFYVWRSGAWEIDTALQKQAEAAQVLAERDNQLRSAQLRIAPLQYAVNLDMATEQEKASLLAWMSYSVDVSRVEQQPGFPFTIAWPLSPA